MRPDADRHTPLRHLTQCQRLPASVPVRGHRIAILACLVLLLLPSAARSAPRILAATVEGVSGGDTAKRLTATDARYLPLLGVYAQANAYGADSRNPPKKGPREFFQEFLDLLLKVLVSISFAVSIAAAVKLWFDERAAKRRKNLRIRICPGCYHLVRRRKATRCPYCRVELAPGSRLATSPPRSEPDRDELAREEPILRTQTQQPVREELIGEERRSTRRLEGPIREEPVRQEPTPKERVRVEPIREEPLREVPQERGSEDEEDDEWEEDEWERENQARRQKEFIYIIVIASVVGWVAGALLLLFPFR